MRIVATVKRLQRRALAHQIGDGHPTAGALRARQSNRQRCGSIRIGAGHNGGKHVVEQWRKPLPLALPRIELCDRIAGHGVPSKIQ